MQQLEAEHAADESFAHELADELQLLADTGLVRNAEMLGYMLRGFFEHQRRHIEWENRVLLPLARADAHAGGPRRVAGLDHVQRQARVRQALGGHAQAHARRAGDVPPMRLTSRQLAPTASSRDSGERGLHIASRAKKRPGAKPGL